MRKWMRERLQRRKKNSPEPEGAAPPPLQPAYFEADQSPPETIKTETAEAVPSTDEPIGEAEQQAQASAEVAPRSSARPRSSGDSQAGRVRRRRGGRGRSRGREQAVAQAFTPAVAKGIIPATPTEGAVASLESEAPASDAAPDVVAPRVPAASTAAARAPRGVVVLAIGLPGSGKSSWFKRNSVVPLSTDMVRSLLFDDVREQRFQDLVFSNLRSMLKARLIAKRPMNYVDATNLTPQERQHWIKLAKDYGYEVHAVFFDVPLEVCIDRHQKRDRVVPEDVMRRMAGKLKPPAFEEGFAKITVVKVKKKEATVPEAQT
ncbi:MAG TPA: AAA family ATPase [Candidatus Sulfotelmatobacter sp.]